MQVNNKTSRSVRERGYFELKLIITFKVKDKYKYMNKAKRLRKISLQTKYINQDELANYKDMEQNLILKLIFTYFSIYFLTT